MANIAIAIQIITTLLQDAATAAGGDITAAQLATIIQNCNAAISQLNLDIAKAKAIGK